jgi:hypothetical protein
MMATAASTIGANLPAGTAAASNTSNHSPRRAMSGHGEKMVSTAPRMSPTTNRRGANGRHEGHAPFAHSRSALPRP